MAWDLASAGVELRTRGFLEERVAAGDLDRPCAGLLREAMDRAAGKHPGGFVYLLADALGASTGAALEAGSLAQLFYAAASLTDDLQDADQHDALARRDPRLQLNALAQLLCAVGARGPGLAAAAGDAAALSTLTATFQAGLAMLTGQRLELASGAWTVERYRRVAQLSAGRQFEAYLTMAALAAAVPPRRLVPVGRPLGLLLQVHHDQASGDCRLRGLPPRAVAALRQAACGEVRAAVAGAPRRARACLESFVAPLL